MSTAAAVVVTQLNDALAGAADGRAIVAYEPVRAIGAALTAPVEHVAAVTRGPEAHVQDLTSEGIG